MSTCYMKLLIVTLVAASTMALAGSAHAQPNDDEARVVNLDEVLAQVSEQNEEWGVTQARIEQAQAVRRQALAELLPSVSVSAQGTRYGEEIAFGGEQVRPQYDWGANARAAIAVFDGTNYPMLSRAGELLEASKALAKWRRRTVLFEAAQAFYVLAASQDRVEIARETVALRQAQLERAQALLDAGIAVRLDVERARTQFLEAKQDLIEARAQVGNADDALASLLALEPTTRVRAEVQREGPEVPPEAAPLDQVDERSDFAAVRRQIEATRLSREAIWWSFLPLVELQANGRAGPESAFSNPDGFTWSLTLSATWLLYDGGARYGRIDQLEAEVKEQNLEYQRELRQAKVGVRQALRDWQTAVAAVEVARQQVEAARQAFESARARFEQGLATSVDVADASEALFRAETALNQRILQARTAAAEYDYLIDIGGYGTD